MDFAIKRGQGRFLWRVFEQVQVIHLPPARLGGVELARLGVVAVVAALAPGAQVRLVVVRLVLIHVGDGQDDRRAGVRVLQVIPRPAALGLAAVAGALQDAAAQRLPLRRLRREPPG